MSAKAEKKAEAAAAPAEGAPKKKKGLLLIIVGVVVLLVAGGGGAAFMMMNKHDKKAQHAKADKHDKADGEHEEGGEDDASGDEGGDGKDKKKTPIFYTMEPFVVNLAGDSQHYLQVGVDLKLSKDEFIEKIKVVIPEIRNEVVLLLSSKQMEDLASMDGKNYLRAQIRKAANKSIGVKDSVKRKSTDENAEPVAHDEDIDAYPPPKRGVVDVLLTSFVIQ